MFGFVSTSGLQLALWTRSCSHPRQRKTLDIVTLFHKASSPASVRVAGVLQKASARATAGTQTTSAREQFDLNITEDPPTEDQVKTILGYVGPSGIASVIKGAKDEKDALRKFKESNGNFIQPVVRSLSLHGSGVDDNTNGDFRLWIGAMARRSLAITSRRS